MSENQENRGHLERMIRLGYPSEEAMAGLLTWRNPVELSSYVLEMISADESLKDEFEELQGLLAPELGTVDEALFGLKTWVNARASGPEALVRAADDPTLPPWVRKWCRLCIPEATASELEGTIKTAPSWLEAAIEKSGLSISTLVSWDRAARMIDDLRIEEPSSASITEDLSGMSDAYIDSGRPSLAVSMRSADSTGPEAEKGQFPFVSIQPASDPNVLEVLVAYSGPEASDVRGAVLLFRFRDDRTREQVYVFVPLSPHGPGAWIGFVSLRGARVLSSLRRVGTYFFAVTDHP